MTPKLPPGERMAVILSAAVKVANKQGLSEVTFRTVADMCEMKTKPRTVAHYFKIGDLRRAVIADKRSNNEVHVSAVAMGVKLT